MLARLAGAQEIIRPLARRRHGPTHPRAASTEAIPRARSSPGSGATGSVLEAAKARGTGLKRTPTRRTWITNAPQHPRVPLRNTGYFTYMIFDSLANHSLYARPGPRVAQGFTWLENFSPTSSDGRYNIAGDELYALVQSYDTVFPAEKKFEAHRKFLDIQYAVRGRETIHFAPISALHPTTAYNVKKDCLHYVDPSFSTPRHFEPGSFAIFFPQDGHKPGCFNGAFAHVKKVVIKVRV